MINLSFTSLNLSAILLIFVSWILKYESSLDSITCNKLPIYPQLFVSFFCFYMQRMLPLFSHHFWILAQSRIRVEGQDEDTDKQESCTKASQLPSPRSHRPRHEHGIILLNFFFKLFFKSLSCFHRHWADLPLRQFYSAD